MITSDIDGILVWLTQDDRDNQRPALGIIHGEDWGCKYIVCDIPVDGDPQNINKFNALSSALKCFAERLPATA